MARLHEYEGKKLLANAGFTVPRGAVAASADQAVAAAKAIGGPCVVKIQAWTTGRAAIGGIALVKSPEEAGQAAARMLAMRVGNFPVRQVLVEERIPIARELFVSLSIDDRNRSPVLLLGLRGGSGIEERACDIARVACDVATGPDKTALGAAVAGSDLPAAMKNAVIDAAGKVFALAKSIDARSVEINPLAVLEDGCLVAADCRMTIDDYAVYRHPELGIEIARELDHPPTELERIAYAAEQADHRGTFFFAQMNTAAPKPPQPGSRGLIGFHGAGGGGSMMAMDAVTNEGFTIANFTDTSGNPSPAKVYRAARVILAQPGLVGYFGSGSGVASQEQFWSAYGLAKAFWEMELDIPAVIRLGGNTEDRAVEILHRASKGLPTVVEGYRKTDPPAKIAARFGELVDGGSRGQAKHVWTPRAPRKPAFVGAAGSHCFPVKNGKVWIDAAAWRKHPMPIVARANGLLRDDGGNPVTTLGAEEFAAKDSDMIACEVECRCDGVEGLFVELDIPGLDSVIAGVR